MINNVLFRLAAVTLLTAPTFAQWGAVDAEIELTMNHCGDKYD